MWWGDVFGETRDTANSSQASEPPSEFSKLQHNPQHNAKHSKQQNSPRRTVCERAIEDDPGLLCKARSIRLPAVAVCSSRALGGVQPAQSRCQGQTWGNGCSLWLMTSLTSSLPSFSQSRTNWPRWPGSTDWQARGSFVAFAGLALLSLNPERFGVLRRREPSLRVLSCCCAVSTKQGFPWWHVQMIW